jgi:NADPH:quinone reductase-like Zn-dependent oxidoreductase
MTMRAVRLQAPGGPEQLSVEQIPTPAPGEGEVLVRVHAAAITRNELDWPEDRFPAIPSYELSGVVEAVGPGAESVEVGREVVALTPFDRDGVAADYAIVPVGVLASKPSAVDHVQSAALPMPALTAWQGLHEHGRLQEGQRVLILGAGGGVGHIAGQIASRHFGAHVIGTASAASADFARSAGANERIDPDAVDGSVEPVDLIFDTVGGALLERAAGVLRTGGTIVTVADEPPEDLEATFFIVEPNGAQLEELVRMVDRGILRPSVDSVFPLEDARAAFERSLLPAKRGKVVLAVAS